MSESNGTTEATPRVATPVEVVAIPSDRCWFDPRLLMANLQVQIVDIPITGPGTAQIAPADPTRVALTVVAYQEQVQDTRVAPWSDPVNYRLDDLTTGQSKTYKLFDYPGLIGLEWYCYVEMNTTVRVAMVTRR